MNVRQFCPHTLTGKDSYGNSKIVCDLMILWRFSYLYLVDLFVSAQVGSQHIYQPVGKPGKRTSILIDSSYVIKYTLRGKKKRNTAKNKYQCKSTEVLSIKCWWGTKGKCRDIFVMTVFCYQIIYVSLHCRIVEYYFYSKMTTSHLLSTNVSQHWVLVCVHHSYLIINTDDTSDTLAR